METNEFDLVILGAGTGGYVAAIRASQLGMKVAVVEKDRLGGTCLHRGCIPSKALLRSAEVYHTVLNSSRYGVDVAACSIHFSNIQERKRAIVEQLHKGVQYLMKKGKIEVFQGEGRVMGPSIFSPQAGAVAVTRTDGSSEILVPKHLILATGSRPKAIPGLEADGRYVLTSNEALELEALPESMLIVGGGVIGIEWASLLNDLGVDVKVVEFADRILPQEDIDISKEMTRLLQGRGIQIVTDAKVLPETLLKDGGKVRIEADQGGKIVAMEADQMLVSVGRTPSVDQIGLDNTEVKVVGGAIEVNSCYQTAEKHIYAIGDVIGGLQLAHVAAHEGIAAVEHIAGLNPHPVDYVKVPKVTYSRPETASIGWTEEEAVRRGHAVKVGRFPFQAIGKALIDGDHEGFVKIVADAKSDDLLGIHMIGPHASDLIAEGALAATLDATPWEIALSIHPHPSLSEVLGEAALAVDLKSIHI